MLSSPKTSLVIIGVITVILLTQYIIPATFRPSLPSYNDLKAPISQSLSPYTSALTGSNTSPVPQINHNESASNSTLGFERVFAIGLKERSDKRDAVALTSSLLGFNVEWIDGVRGESIPDKAVPFGTDRKKLWENNLGSWRGHMNAVREIIEKNYSSALIMEDDMDWDVRLKSQLLKVAEGTRYLQSLPPYNPPTEQDILARSQLEDSPYGQDWDLLWLGHCGEIFPEVLGEHLNHPPGSDKHSAIFTKYTIENDKTVPPPNHATGFQDFKAHPYTRWVHKTGGPICTFAYALSHRGAQKVLFDLSVDHLNGPFDNSLSDLCRWGMESQRMGMRCYSVTPGVFFHHKAKGYINGDSDIQKVGGDEMKEIRKMGHTENVVWSARNNIGNLLRGSEMITEYEEDKKV